MGLFSRYFPDKICLVDIPEMIIILHMLHNIYIYIYYKYIAYIWQLPCKSLEQILKLIWLSQIQLQIIILENKEDNQFQSEFVQ